MAPLYPWQYLYYQYLPLPSISAFSTDLGGKTIIVTGANTGLGLEAARHLARMGPRKLILACRDARLGNQAVWDIRDDTGYEPECWVLDLASFESVRGFAERFEREGGGRLDILIENAAVSFPTYETSEDGWETMLKVNHLGTAHLALRLLPFLLAAPAEPGPRLVVVTSEMHYWVYDRGAMLSERLLETLNDEERCQQWGTMPMRYGATKLMNILFTLSLSSRLARLQPPTRLTANTVNPGFCHSSLTRHMAHPLLSALKYVAARSTEAGSRTLVHAALAPELWGVSGVYLNACQEREPGDFVVSDEGKHAGEKLWVETLEVLFKAEPGLREVLKACGLEED
ncbi:NAD(P)-binding protein [Calocera viscosa TUFC12733]|uniref:NAD(P)-binding protein n=1 Tax=Calocera viscosa (strain TUFC12733) TaxID=1330018 RepID=A0A167LUT5_CALVF|nr:NAD(P)-binding protein [Calocera viscosa TUFC12733]